LVPAFTARALEKALHRINLISKMSLWFSILLDETAATFARVSTGRRPARGAAFAPPRLAASAGGPALRPVNHVTVRRLCIRIDRRRDLLLVALATIIGAAAVTASWPKMSRRASSRFSIKPLPGIGFTFTLAQQPDMRRVLSVAHAEFARIADMNNVHDSLMNNVHDSLPHFEQERVTIMGAKLGRHRHYVETRKGVKSIYFAHQPRDAIRHVKYATD
jgi:hypothetical protein